ncbi:MAG: ATP synthase F1 subunit delta [Patescibacteria group bacterium]|jgi:F-type H+-transporting ATPase subunit delta
MSKTSLRYARALALALGEKVSVAELKETAENLDLAAEVLSEKTAQNFFANSRIATVEKEKVVTKVFGKAGEKFENFLKLVVHHGRMSEIAGIAESFRAVLNESGGVATALIESARVLDEKELRGLAAALRKMTGREIAVEPRVNAQILGGVKILLGDELIDLSLTGKLSRLQKALN